MFSCHLRVKIWSLLVGCLGASETLAQFGGERQEKTAYTTANISFQSWKNPPYRHRFFAAWRAWRAAIASKAQMQAWWMERVSLQSRGGLRWLLGNVMVRVVMRSIFPMSPSSWEEEKYRTDGHKFFLFYVLCVFRIQWEGSLWLEFPSETFSQTKCFSQSFLPTSLTAVGPPARPWSCIAWRVRKHRWKWCEVWECW